MRISSKDDAICRGIRVWLQGVAVLPKWERDIPMIGWRVSETWRSPWSVCTSRFAFGILADAPTDDMAQVARPETAGGTLPGFTCVWGIVLLDWIVSFEMAGGALFGSTMHFRLPLRSFAKEFCCVYRPLFAFRCHCCDSLDSRPK